MIRAVAPAALGFTDVLSMLGFVWLAAGLSALTLILVIVAKSAGRGSRGRLGTAGILLMILALLFAGTGLLVRHMAPNGIIRPAAVDTAPVLTPERMEAQMDKLAPECAGTWQTVSTSDYPGLSRARVCAKGRIAYVTFKNSSAAAIYRAPVESKIDDLLKQYGSDTRAQGDWSLLNGKLWLVFGEHSQLNTLQKAWGGTLSDVNAE